MLQKLKQRSARRDLAGRLYAELVARARLPIFFERFRVADTLDGRLDILLLHAWLVLERLAQPEFRDLAQGLTDRLFAGFDEAMRELGSGDMGMGRRMKSIADAFYGRIGAYQKAEGEDALTAAILRNVYRGDDLAEGNARGLALYAIQAKACLLRCDPAQGHLDFGSCWEIEHI